MLQMFHEQQGDFLVPEGPIVHVNLGACVSACVRVLLVRMCFCVS